MDSDASEKTVTTNAPVLAVSRVKLEPANLEKPDQPEL